MTYPDISPVLVEIGPLKVHWYGMMYLAAFVTCWILGRWRARHQSFWGWTKEHVDDFVFWGATGAVLGGRLGYMFFYAFDKLLADPTNLLRIWEGGMSFHGGLLGAILAIWFFARKTKKNFFEVADFVAPIVPIGLFFGRIGNFINAELWGGPTNVIWAMEVPCERAFDLCERLGMTNSPFSIPVHPSQLYQALLEGLILFILLWLFSNRHRPPMMLSGLFILGYGLARALVEVFRLPDAHIGYLYNTDWLTMGMILTAPMIIFGSFLVLLSLKNKAAK